MHLAVNICFEKGCSQRLSQVVNEKLCNLLLLLLLSGSEPCQEYWKYIGSGRYHSQLCWSHVLSNDEELPHGWLGKTSWY